MCRHAAYLGPAISLQSFLIDPPHSLYRQSWDARELKYARLNADGYGFGWFDTDGSPAAYTSPAAIWADHNLPYLARSMRQTLWLGEVRSATIGNPVHAFNTQPFCDDRWLFVHNGFIREFHEKVRPALTARMSPAVVADIRGNTDSEFLFAFLRQMRVENADISIPDAMRRLFEVLDELVSGQQALLNLLVTDGVTLYASRHAINHESPSLYYSRDESGFPDGCLVASERFSDSSGWQSVGEQQLLALGSDREPRLQSL